jgi:hypothetical protein
VVGGSTIQIWGNLLPSVVRLDRFHDIQVRIVRRRWGPRKVVVLSTDTGQRQFIAMSSSVDDASLDAACTRVNTFVKAAVSGSQKDAT